MLMTVTSCIRCGNLVSWPHFAWETGSHRHVNLRNAYWCFGVPWPNEVQAGALDQRIWTKHGQELRSIHKRIPELSRNQVCVIALSSLYMAQTFLVRPCWLWLFYLPRIASRGLRCILPRPSCFGRTVLSCHWSRLKSPISRLCVIT